MPLIKINMANPSIKRIKTIRKRAQGRWRKESRSALRKYAKTAGPDFKAYYGLK